MLEGTAAASARPQPYLTIRPSGGWRALNLRQIWMFRDLLVSLGQRDVKLRYKQTALGVAWVLLQPLMAAGIFSFVFGKVAGFTSGGVPYFLFAYAGIMGWTLVQSTLTKASACLVGNANLVSKVFFPRLVLPLSTLFGTLLDFGVACGLLAVLMVWYQVFPGVQILVFPIAVLLLLGLGLGCGLMGAALTVDYRDVQYVLPVATQFLMYASPVAYPSSSVPAPYQLFYFLNPLTPLLEAMRWSLFGQGTLSLGWLAYSAGWTVLMLFAGAYVFKSLEKKFADVI